MKTISFPVRLVRFGAKVRRVTIGYLTVPDSVRCGPWPVLLLPDSNATVLRANFLRYVSNESAKLAPVDKEIELPFVKKKVSVPASTARLRFQISSGIDEIDPRTAIQLVSAAISNEYVDRLSKVLATSKSESYDTTNLALISGVLGKRALSAFGQNIRITDNHLRMDAHSSAEDSTIEYAD